MQQIQEDSSFEKTQILITDIPKDKFIKKWPASLENEIFKDNFPDLRSKLQYFTPLQFLNRIVIIMNDSESTQQIYHYLKDKVISKPMKIFITESLLGNQQPRANSFDDSAKSNIEFNKTTNPFIIETTDIKNDNNTDLKHSNKSSTKSSRSNSNGSIKISFNRPILSLDTNPLKTGISSSSLSFGSASLSPDRASIDSPTLLKVGKNDKLHYYQEPLPKGKESEELIGDNNTNNINKNNSNNNNQDMTPFASNGSRTPTSIITRDSAKINDDDDDDKLSVNTNINNNDESSSNLISNTPPKSPNITINHYFE